jgi:hypothetical protein
MLCAGLCTQVRFDVALTCQEYASYLLIDKKPAGAAGAAAMRTNEQKKDEFEGAAESLNIARSLFENLMGLGKAVTGVDAGRLEQHIKYCATTVDKVSVRGPLCAALGMSRHRLEAEGCGEQSIFFTRCRP